MPTTSQKKEKTIKIFVSHRIDLDSQTIDNPLFVNVRCGAVYDKRKNVEMLGDDTGDNISERRNTFNELTVQYWAWKNQDADYYGLCHYRRYLSFSSHHYDVAFINDHSNGCILDTAITSKAIEKYHLDEMHMKDEIQKYDLICTTPFPLDKFGITSNYDAMKGAPLWHKIEDVDKAIAVIEDKYPQMVEATKYYFFESKKNWLFNCWVMSKELFEKFCQFQFNVLFELEKQIDDTYYSERQRRGLGVIGERLFGIFVTYVLSLKKYKVKEQQLVFFSSPERQELYPFHKQGNVPIVLNSSDYYMPYVSCLIKSAIAHNAKHRYLDFIILNKAISDENKRKIASMLENEKYVSVRFFDMKSITSGLSFFVASPNYAEEAYYRMLAPWVLKNYDKAIVMDADIIFDGDITELYNEEIDGFYLAAVKDVVYQGMLNNPFEDHLRYAKKEMGLRNPYDYINTGVLLMNLKLLRQGFTMENVLQYMESHKMRIQEQDIINMLFQGKIKFVDMKYNYFLETSQWVKDQLEFTPADSVRKYRETDGSAISLHWANQPKPWNDFDEPYAEKFWAVARKTPFYELILHRYISSAAVGAANAANLVCGEDPYNRFAFPWRSVRPGSRIVLYGGGVVGKMFLRQLANNPYCHVVAVCDQNPAATGIREAPVIDVRQLCDLDPDFYDLVLIDLERKDIATAIRADLELSGIPPQKIKWVDPHRR